MEPGAETVPLHVTRCDPAIVERRGIQYPRFLHGGPAPSVPAIEIPNREVRRLPRPRGEP